MSQTGLDPDFGGMIGQYLRDVDHALAKLDPNRRKELVEEIEQHLNELRSVHPVHNRSEMENLFDRIGRPGDIAEAALEDEDGRPGSGPGRRLRILVSALVLVILAAAGIVVAFTLPNRPVVPPARSITVPDVLGMSLAAAEGDALSSGLHVATTQEVPSQTIPAGTVASQSPQAGSRVTSGTRVLLSLSRGPSIVTTTTSPLAALLPSGIYLDGGPGTPHYYISLSSDQGNGTISGSLSFLYQDGQTSPVFSFTGLTNSGTATLTPSSDSPISATYSTKQLQLGECTQYLKFARSLSQCTFTFSPGGALQ
jgi:hypothetical protein